MEGLSNKNRPHGLIFSRSLEVTCKIGLMKWIQNDATTTKPHVKTQIPKRRFADTQLQKNAKIQQKDKKKNPHSYKDMLKKEPDTKLLPQIHSDH